MCYRTLNRFVHPITRNKSLNLIDTQIVDDWWNTMLVNGVTNNYRWIFYQTYYEIWLLDSLLNWTYYGIWSLIVCSSLVWVAPPPHPLPSPASRTITVDLCRWFIITFDSIWQLVVKMECNPRQKWHPRVTGPHPPPSAGCIPAAKVCGVSVL